MNHPSDLGWKMSSPWYWNLGALSLVRWYSGSNILGYSVSKLVITKLGCVHETQLKPVGIGLGQTESVDRNAGTLVLWFFWYAGTLGAALH